MKLFRLFQLPFPNECSAGVFYVLCSYIPPVIPPRDYGFLGSLIFGALYYLGFIYIANSVIRRLSGTSFIALAISDAAAKKNFILLGLLGSIPFGLGVSDFGGFWYFPYWNTVFYYLLGYALLGWVFYALFLVMIYLACKLIFDRLVGNRPVPVRYYRFERKYYRMLGVIGGWIAAMVFTVSMQNSYWLTQFSFIINQPKPPFLYWYWWLIAMAGWIILCEYVAYRKRRPALLSVTLHGNFVPLLAALTAGLVFGITNELQNLPINLWHYANYPWPGMMVFDIPLFVILAWPLHIIGVVEFYRSFGTERVSNALFAPPSKKTL